MTRNNIKGQPIRIPVKSASQNKKCNEILVNFDEIYIEKFKKKIKFFIPSIKKL